MNQKIIELIQQFLKENKILSKKQESGYFTAPDGKGLLSVMEQNGTFDWSEETLIENMREVVVQLTRGKGTAVNWFKKFWNFLKGQDIVADEGSFPPIEIDNTFERRIFIAKYLQDPDNRINDLRDILWVSERTIEQDLNVLLGVIEEETIQVCGKKFTIPDVGRRLNRLQMASTVHPLLLTSNLTQIIVMLRGLKLLKDDPAVGPYSNSQAVSIWQQLSDYAKKRILYVAENLIPDDLEWYHALEKAQNEYAFYSERMCSHYGDNCVLDCLKNGKTCYIEYRSGPAEQSVFYENCTVKKYDYAKQSVIICLEDGKEKELYLDSVLSSAYTKELLI